MCVVVCVPSYHWQSRHASAFSATGSGQSISERGLSPYFLEMKNGYVEIWGLL